jgi:hypothetical protein
MHINYLIKQLISYEHSLEDKLDMLTEIAIMTSNTKVLKATEEVRNELVSHDESQEIRADGIRSDEHPGHISNFQL